MKCLLFRSIAAMCLTGSVLAAVPALDEQANDLAVALSRGMSATSRDGNVWTFFSCRNGTLTPLAPCAPLGENLPALSPAGKDYPLVTVNTARVPVREGRKLAVGIAPHEVVIHPGVRESAVVRFTPTASGLYEVCVNVTDLNTQGPQNAEAGVAVTLTSGKQTFFRADLVGEKKAGSADSRSLTQRLEKGIPVDLIIDSKGSHTCDATGVRLSFRRLKISEISIPGEWARMPPPNVDPALAQISTVYPRPWSGQRASLAYARISAPVDGVAVRSAQGQNAVTVDTGALSVDWTAAIAATNAVPALPPDRLSLWKKNESGPKSAITDPHLVTIGRSFRLFKDTLPDTEVLLPAVIVTDGNSEDGFGGYVILLDTAADWAFTRQKCGFTLSSSAASKSVIARFDGNWTAGLRCLVQALDLAPAVKDIFMKRYAEFMKGINPAPDPDLFLQVIAEWIRDDARWACSADGWTAYLKDRLTRRAKLLSDPRLKETLERGILFNTRRNPTWNHCVAQYFGWRQSAGGSLLVLERPGRSNATRDLIKGRLPRGSYLEPRLSYNAGKIAFAFVETDGALNPYAMKVNEESGDDHYYHLYTMNADGSHLKKQTAGVYDDLMPDWLPDGDIVFMSTRRRSMSRCFWYGYSNRWQAYTLFRMKPDGTNLCQLSWNDVSEWFPCVNNDGELIFARWDYIDRDAVRHQNLWSMRPDGTNPKAVWGNETPNPHCTFQARPIPGSGKIVCIASAHHACTAGPVILIDPSVDENSEAAITHVTPGHYPEIDMPEPGDRSPYADNDWYNSPWPYGEDLFLVAWSREALHYEPSRPNPPAALGLYVLSSDGTRELLYRDPLLNCCAPQPLAPRPAPPVLESRPDPALKAAKKGEVFISDVYRGIPKAPRGSVKQIRVVQIFPRTAPDQYVPLTGGGGHENARGVLGTATVEADGSARFLVPAGKAVLFQVLDADGFAWRTMRSTTSVMPGERVSCVGCHESKREVSTATRTLSAAMKRPAEDLARTPESGRPWGFTENIQPLFDAKCVSCHGDTDPKGGIALTRTPDPRFGGVNGGFSRAYSTLCFTDTLKDQNQTNGPAFKLWHRRMRKNANGEMCPMIPCWPEYNHVQTTPEGPGVNALGSGLIDHLRRGKHAARVTPEDLRKLATWIDLNALFFGCYEEPCLERQRRGEPIPFPDHQ